MDIETTIQANHRLKRRIKNTVYYSQLDAPPATLKAEFCNLNFSPMTSGLNIFTDLHIIAHDHWNWIFFLHSRIIGIGSSSSTPGSLELDLLPPLLVQVSTDILQP